MKTLLFIFAVMCSAFFSSCSKRLRKEGNGHITTTVRSLSSFTAIDAEGIFTIYTHTAPQSRVEITTDENIAPEVRTYVQNGVLYVEMNDDYFNYDFHQMTVHIFGPEYSRASMNGKVSLFVVDTLHVPALDIEHDGEGTSEVRFMGSRLHYGVNGTADSKASGSAAQLDVTVNGKANVDFLRLMAHTADVDVNGAGKVYVACSEQLDATISGSGHIYYLGSPQLVTHISGIGNVSPY